MSEPAQRLAGQVAVVTGASRGIGRAIAIRLGALGATVVLNYLKEDARCAEAVQAVTQAGGPAPSAVRADIGRPEEARRLIEDVLARHGRLDVLINNAAHQTSALLHKMSDADWQSVIDVNLSAVFYLCRAALPAMIAARSGHIVNIASASSYMARKGAASYIASKHGLIGLTKALALETASQGVLVNAVAPGLTETDLVAGLTEAQREGLMNLVPLKRIARPEEVADMVAYVVTRAGYSTGNVFHCSGGAIMG